MAPKTTDPSTQRLLTALGDRIVELRLSRSWEPADLAGRMDMDPNYLWRIETGRQNLSFRNVARLANAFQLSLADLLGPIDVSDLDLTTRPYEKRQTD